ncbi:25-hydroxycholesterol 7-alpha-hydroxylase [Colletotrichum siamense]|uniref:25-hydroxycholesterol 7-alpha-hydroxylase n=1 Tax=Colletotrichum siamense TaxID=690259 RepID=UPI001872EA12|nr:25-hydroxycholesterol 7-alpha-hydroxylase [Colletotrichum siamense]KAF5505312.1 25-hydroxycholesterol 7-alpha-hydroxylase [Colletotrichum siamense]
MAMLANYAPTAFWAVYEILSRPRLVQEIREEVRKAITKGDEADWALDISILKTACPLLLSSIQEAQRVNSVQAGIREILRDTTITTEDRSVLLKKGSYLQINGISTLRDLETWGSDAADFDPYRFMIHQDEETRDSYASRGCCQRAAAKRIFGLGRCATCVSRKVVCNRGHHGACCDAGSEV